MLIKVIVIGKLKDRLMQSRCYEYAKWIGGYSKVEVKELPDSTVEKEGEAILRELGKDGNAYIAVLSEEGQEFTSVAFSAHLQRIDRKVVFVIGSGHSQKTSAINHAVVMVSHRKDN